MEKINVAELLKDCPIGMELDCTIWDSEAKVFLNRVLNEDLIYPIEVIVKYNNIEYLKSFTIYGAFNDLPYCKCVIFPKGKTTWEGFVPPCQFKDGDIIYNQCIEAVAIFCKQTDDSTISHCFQNKWKELKLCHYHCKLLSDWRLATEEEKARLFQAIKDNGYKWNSETKTLEKLITPKFHLGQWITDGYLGGQITSIEDNYSCYKIAGFIGGISISIPFILQDNYHLWTIQDAKDGDVLFHSDSASNGIFIFKEILQRGTLQKVICYCDYDSEDGFCLGENHTCCWTDSKILHPATKEQRDLLFQKMKEAGYKWDEEKKELKKIEPKFKVGDRIRLKNGGSIVERN